MRTTLTLDDDLANELREEARRSRQPFKTVVNETLRRGLAAGQKPGRSAGRFRVRAKACGFRPGIDLMRLNQLVDELEIDRIAPPRKRRRA
jgi:hypothetical protein